MAKKHQLVTGPAPGAGSGIPSTREQLIQEIAKRDHVAYGHGYAGTYYVNRGGIIRAEHYVCVWPSVSESKRSQMAMWMKIKSSITEGFRNVVGIDHTRMRWLSRLLRHK